MVFFNYSTMQVAAKIVYYGPGLCGKTTNLQYLYDHTTSDSRGEMVSLQTETDRTLFFDLLPIDLGSIGGFKTKIQLYTVPGQVFYNTTRRLVLKGVDGIVFVADSQRLMMDANVDSLKNLETNLAEIGVDLKELPMVMQFNKRDLPDVAPVEALKEALNQHDWPCYEASALTGQGVFETLAGVAKLTLASLKERLGSERGADRRGGPRRPRVAPQTAPRVAPQTAPRVVPQSAPPPRPSTQTATQPMAAAIATEAAPAHATAAVAAPAPTNGHVELDRDLSLTLPTSSLRRARRLSVSLRLEDDDRNVVGVVQRGYPLGEHPDLSELLLRLSLSVTPGDERR